MKLGNPWQYEVAAMMSQLGCVTLAPETIDAVYSGGKLSDSEQAQFESHPTVAFGLLSKIPRLEPIAWMIRNQNSPSHAMDESAPMDMRQAAEILRLTLEYERLIQRGVSRTEAVHTLSRQNKGFNPEFFNALISLDPNAEEGEVRKCRIDMLSPGMIVQGEVRSVDGSLVISKGQEVTPPLILKLKNLLARKMVASEMLTSMPATTLSFVKSASK